MIDAVRSEWIKFRTVRANVVLIIIAVGAPLVLSVLIAAIATFELESPRNVFSAIVLAPCFVCAFLAGVLGVLGIGQEYRHNTIRVTFAAQPNRSVVLRAKLVVNALFGLAIGLFTQLLCLLVSGLIVAGRNIDIAVAWEAVTGQVVLCGLMTVFGFGLGCVLRQPAGAIPAFLIWPLIVEGIVGAILSSIDEGLVRWLPFQSGLRLAVIDTYDADYFGRVAGGVYFSVWTAAVLTFGWWLVHRRDA